MDYSTSTDRFKLDSLPKPNDTSRPTIPYSQFPRPALPSISTSYDYSQHARGEDQSPNATTSDSSRHPHSIDLIMSPTTSSAHRRRRSSLLNGFDTGPHSRGAGSRRQLNGQDEQKWSEGSGGDTSPSADGSTSVGDELELDDLLEAEELDDDEETGLTGPDRNRRTSQKNRNTLLDERIASSSKLTQQERNEANQTLIKKFAVNGALIGLWYLFSLSISLYNTWMFSKDHLDFPFPLFTTSMHMLVQFSLASLVLYVLPRYRPRYNSISNKDNIHATDADRAKHEAEEKKPLMTRFFYFTRLGPCGVATGLDIGLGNMSLQFISLSFYTMCKSSSLAFVLLFAFLFRLESPSWRLIAIIGTMIAGVIMMVFGELKFDGHGFILVISAAFFSGFRWGLTQILLLRNPATSNPFSSIFYLAPIMFITMLSLAIPVEGFGGLAQAFSDLAAERGVLVAPLILLFPGVIAFLMTASEFALLKRTSVVTLSIAGIFKEVVTIGAAGLIFDDRLTPINVSGLFVTIGAIAAYNYIKISKMRNDALEKAQNYKGYSAANQEGDGEEHEQWEMAERSNASADSGQGHAHNDTGETKGDARGVPGAGEESIR